MTEDNYLAIAGIKHYFFCKRRWALVHVEQQWAENALTADGHILHETVHDSGFTEKRGHILLSRGMPIKSEQYKINGICDMVELIADENGVLIHGRDGRYRVYPVEYKRGKPDEADLRQLCAQVLCLEEMFAIKIPQAAIYYAGLRRRQVYEMTSLLREEVISAVKEMNELMSRGYTPKVKPQKYCRNCSLYEICAPSILKTESVKNYLTEVLSEQ